jgi:phosphoribosylamine--glycine ligase
MNTLIIGSGGREHAMGKALKNSKNIGDLYSLPGSSALLQISKVLDLEKQSLDPDNFENIYNQIVDKDIELVVVGPEAPLVEGLSDYLRERGILVFGPDSEGAKLEGDKIFAKDFMQEFGIPTGTYTKVSNSKSLEKAFEKHSEDPFYVFKYKDLAGGKGVLVSSSKDEIRDFAKSFGVTDDQAEVVGYLEEPLEGWELSYICIVGDEGYQVCPILQDHKRLKDGDIGPNTGGMGVAGPLKLDAALEKEIVDTMVLPTLKGIEDRDILYRGVVYLGVMVTDKGPKLLEYNVRFGDPEAQLIFPLVESDWFETFKSVSMGQEFSIKQSANYGCCIVLASEGYPDSPIKGAEISGLEKLEEANICHAGTKKVDGKWNVNGGRVLNVLEISKTLGEAIEGADLKASKLDFKGMQKRTDIGSKVL